MKAARPHPPYPAARLSQSLPGRQRGVVLFITLIALVAMTLAAIALVRSVDTGNTVSGNLAFKQGATLAGDTAAETALAALRPLAASVNSYNDDPAQGYYATSQDNLDMTGNQDDATKARVDWNHNACSGIANAACITPSAEFALTNGYRASYIIHRLCQNAGDPNINNSCATFEEPAGACKKKGEKKYGDDKCYGPDPLAYYRITTRIKGPRNTSSYIETLIHF